MREGFVARLAEDLSNSPALVSTFLGGSSDEEATNCTLCSASDVYVTGFTNSNDFPTFPQVAPPYDDSHNGSMDIFVAHLDNNLAGATGVTYIGGAANDRGNGIVVGPTPNSYVYISGWSTKDSGGNDYPTTTGDSHAGATDVVVTVFKNDLASPLVASRFIGGDSSDNGYEIVLDSSSNPHIIGYSYKSSGSGDYPTNADDTTHNGDYDWIVSKLDSTLSSLSYSTFVGHSAQDKGQAIALDTSTGIVYATGWTKSANMPTASYDTGLGGAQDAFIIKLNPTSGTALAVSSTSPSDGATDVAMDTTITATFSKAMNSSTITTSTFTVTDALGPAVSGTVSYSGNTATFTPAADLGINKTYTATIDGGVEDADGTALGSDYSWSFTITADIPTVSSTSPSDGATGVAVNSTITATFSTAMDGTTITTSTFTVTDASGAVSGTVSYSGSTATFTPAADLSTDTTYTATITTGAKSATGVAMASDYTWSFTTAAETPTVSSTSPSDGATDVALNSDITASFSLAMNDTTITTSTFTVVDSSGTAVDGSVTYNPIATFNPTQDLSMDTTYTATITTGAKSASGVALASDYSWSFTTTAGSAPNTPSGTSPADLTQMTGTSVTLEGSAFDDPDAGDTHTESQLQVRMAGKSYGISSYPASFAQTGTSGSLTTFTVSGLINGMKYFWQIRYMDAGDTWSAWSAEISFIVGTSIPDNSVVIGAGSSALDFQMVSFAQFPDNPSVASVLGLGTPLDTTNFRIGTYDALSGSYVEYGASLAIEPGRGYWFLCRDGLSITVNGVPVTSSQAVEVEMKYNSATGDGWNMIGPPNPANYNWSDVQIVVYDAAGNIVYGPATIGSLASGNPYINVLLYRYENDGLYYSDTTRVEQYQGFWAEVKQGNVYLRFTSGAQVARGASGLKVMLANLFDGAQRWSRRWILATPVAMASGGGPPAPPGEFYDPGAAAGGGGGGCFIATAAYGSPLMPHVQILRAFRDRFLGQNRWGNFLVKTYYRYSPPLAHYITRHNNVKQMVRLGLLPVVAMAWIGLKLGSTALIAWISVLTLTAAGLLLRRTRRGK